MKKKQKLRVFGNHHLFDDRAFKKFLKMMRLTVFCFLIGLAQVMAVETYAQMTKLSMKVNNEPLEKVLKFIEDESEFFFLYNKDLIDVEQKVSVNVKDETIQSILNEVLTGKNINFSVFDRQIVLTNIDLINELIAQQKTVSGKVTDSNNQPLPGVTVVVKGTTNGTVTNADGNYSLANIPSDATLTFSFVGMKTQDLFVGSQTNIDVTMELETIGLDEVVAIGYGTTKKKLVTGANLNVDGAELAEYTPSNVMDGLQGISPGVTITRESGSPGATTEVYIRGAGTLTATNPLYIVDGISVGDIDYLSPSDIESIDILKDAASAAIYGSRAANGVVLVTTKKGTKSSKPQITLDTYWGWSNMYREPEMLNAQQYMQIMNDRAVNSKLKPYDWDAVLEPYVKNLLAQGWQGTNWLDEITQENVLTQSYALNITDGSERSSYSIGASYLDEDGIVSAGGVNSSYKRLNLRFNSEHILFGNEKFSYLTLGENLTFRNSERSNIREGWYYSNDFHNALSASPLMPVYDENGEYHKALAYHSNNGASTNPIADMAARQQYKWPKDNQIVGNVYLKIQPIKDLIIYSSFGINSWFNNYRSYSPTFDLGTPEDVLTKDNVNMSMSQGWTWTLTNTATYKFKLQDDHNFSVIVGQEAMKNAKSMTVGGSKNNSLYKTPERAYLDNVPQPADVNDISTSGSDGFGYSLMSYFGSLSYDYQEKYLFTFILRADGSSNFAEDYRWGTFPSVSAGWILTDESFMDAASNWLDFFKLRFSWGQNGNQNIDPFRYAALIGNSRGSYFGGTMDKYKPNIGRAPVAQPNELITWETSQQLNLGFDANFLSSRLKATFDIYKKDTKDWLVTLPTLATSGTGAPVGNGGGVKNKGVELALTWNDHKGDFTYGISTNVAYNKNEMTELNVANGYMLGNWREVSEGTSEIFKAEPGYPLGYFWGYQTNGILQNQADVDAYVAPAGTVNAGTKYFNDQAPGDFRFIDQPYVDDNGVYHAEGDGAINDKDKVMIGSPRPDWVYGMQLNFGYKGFYATANVNGKAGHQIFKCYRDFNGFTTANYETTIISDPWKGEGTSNSEPRLTEKGRNYTNISDYYLEDADYIRISNVTIGYSFKGMLNDLPLADAKLYVQGKNLGVITRYSGIDPEVGYAGTAWGSGLDLGLYPLARTFLVGLNLTF
jgi:TonB-linked SusC/RagA family outer membrane protein